MADSFTLAAPTVINSHIELIGKNFLIDPRKKITLLYELLQRAHKARRDEQSSIPDRAQSLRA